MTEARPPARQAVLLAAGLGTRLRPVTDSIPKALVPFYNVPALHLGVAQLARAGVERIAINAHHLAHVLEHHVDGVLRPRFPALELYVSHEPRLLGTGGALARLRPWLGGAAFWVVNADAVFLAPLRDLAAAHAASGADATLMVTRDPVAADIRRVRVAADGRIEGFEPDAHPACATFCGVQLLEPGILGHLPQGPSGVIDAGHRPWLAAGATLEAWETHGFWADLGTPETYLDAHRRAWPHLSELLALGLHNR